MGICRIVSCILHNDTLHTIHFDHEPPACVGHDAWKRDWLPALPGELLIVSNEVGLGVVPMGELTRRFVDETGRLHQAMAARCERVLFVTAGLPLPLKGNLA